MNDRFFLVRVATDSTCERSAAVELFYNKFVYLGTLVRDNDEIFASIDAFDNGVNKERLREKTEQ